jgi:hypothetical protein
MMNEKPDLERGIYRLSHSLIVDGQRFIVETDFIHQDGEFLLVLEWGGPSTSQFPSVTLKLDAARLTETTGRPGYFVYDGDLVDPRKRH